MLVYMHLYISCTRRPSSSVGEEACLPPNSATSLGLFPSSHLADLSPPPSSGGDPRLSPISWTAVGAAAFADCSRFDEIPGWLRSLRRRRIKSHTANANSTAPAMPTPTPIPACAPVLRPPPPPLPLELGEFESPLLVWPAAGVGDDSGCVVDAGTLARSGALRGVNSERSLLAHWTEIGHMKA